VSAVTPQFLAVFGVEPIMGRDFTASGNQKGAAPVALVSYGYWRQYLGSSQDGSAQDGSVGVHLRDRYDPVGTGIRQRA